MREAADWTGNNPSHPINAGLGPPPAGSHSTYAPTATRHPIPMPGFEARIVPENITLLPKTASKHRRQRLERAHDRREEGRQSVSLDPARARRTPEEIRGSPPRSARAAATAA